MVMALGTFRLAILQTGPSRRLREAFLWGPFNYNLQKRWRKPVDSARTRLENRTRDLRLDKLVDQLKKLNLVLSLHELMSNQRKGYASVQLLSKWKYEVGLNIPVGAFLSKYPHIFKIYTHPVKKNVCCEVTQKMKDLIEKEAMAVSEAEVATVRRLKKLLMISTDGSLNLHALWLIRKELGLPDDFRNSVLPNYPGDFTIVSPDTLQLVSKDESLAEAEVEKWRAKEYAEKWLSEFETKYAFPVHFPTGFKIEKGSREKLKNWQRLPYLKPYEKKGVNRVGNVERFEKRAVGVLHEFLSLMVEKMIPVERVSHFRRDFSMEVNVRELILKHPGIFYMSTKGGTQTVFLREAYRRGCLVEPNPVYEARRNMLELVLLGRRNTNSVGCVQELAERCNEGSNELFAGTCDGDWAVSIFEGRDERSPTADVSDMEVQSDEEDQD
ncbi:protein ROOT PRIMORDIUM DEFECTIVE 1 isoform X2 [Ananas comosus]|nr:protein ROOT PRIMORDIUM DEFECTIVE 1 isoform X2 [Ananas comosus]CAD1822001.1 unnamed protein product [Ananas comosus var. bracteatus]